MSKSLVALKLMKNIVLKGSNDRAKCRAVLRDLHLSICILMLKF
ncbi:hypothetical protein N483_24800 [Pseudoalteromonas luteoviolacea NCIMB 1944]|nr:hypothetical protein N483_24800 [Pseudoalteromonas luteoviolacea NCIMB 1944]